MSMVRCNFCGKTYDLGLVTVTARYSDTSCFQTPCCNKSADDREFVSMPAFTRINDDASNCQMWAAKPSRRMKTMKQILCELCGHRKQGERCHCSVCTEENGKDGRDLCAECANNIYQ